MTQSAQPTALRARWPGVAAITLIGALVLAALPPPADAAADAPEIVVEDGVTQPVFSHDDAIIETVWVETPVDSDGDGTKDLVAIDIMRPAETEDGLEVPAIYEASPYRAGLDFPGMFYDVNVELAADDRTTGSRGWMGDRQQRSRHALPEHHMEHVDAAQAPDSGESPPSSLPGSYDNYFVPRGYAVIIGEAPGSGRSTGCPTTGGENETLAPKAVVDWLNGRANAYTSDGELVDADWSTGDVGMIGSSYNGTLANAAASTGVDGLQTIVPIVAISSWYDYFRANGLVTAPGGWQGEDADVLADLVTTRDNPEICDDVLEGLTAGQDRATGNYNEFWAERDYLPDAKRVEASVWVIHGLSDWNVKTNQFAQWWYELARHDVDRRIWLHRRGHGGAGFRGDYQDALHRWFDHYLHGIDNGAPDEPMAEVEHDFNQWAEYADWPDPDVADASLRLRPGGGDEPGALSTDQGRGPGHGTEDIVDDSSVSVSELIADPWEDSPHRLAYLTPELNEAVRISGNAEVSIRASIDDEIANLTAVLVDYDADGDPFIVSRGWMNPQNRHSKDRTSPIRPGQEYRFDWDMQADDYIFEPGHRIGLVLLSSDDEFTLLPPPGRTITVSPDRSQLTLPVVGGQQALGF